MLKGLNIKYFQGYEDVKLKFHKGVNCIYGLSSSGKTSLFRAFQLVKDNRPSGFRFHSRFENSKQPTEVEAVTSLAAVKIIKTKGKTGYEIFRDGQGTTQFPKVGRQVPSEVKEALPFDKCLIQEQLDPHFLITGSNSKFAKELNRVTNFDEIDQWKQKMTKKINKNKKLVKGYKEDLASHEQRMEQYSRVDDLIEISQRLLKLEEEKNSLDGDISTLAEMILTNESLDKQLLTLKKKLSAEDELLEAWSRIKDLQKIDRYKELVNNSKLFALELRKESVKVDDLAVAIETLHLSFAMFDQSSGATRLRDNHERAKKIYESELLEAGGIRDDIVNLGKELDNCPLCGNDINDDCIERLVS